MNKRSLLFVIVGISLFLTCWTVRSQVEMNARDKLRAVEKELRETRRMCEVVSLAKLSPQTHVSSQELVSLVRESLKRCSVPNEALVSIQHRSGDRQGYACDVRLTGISARTAAQWRLLLAKSAPYWNAVELSIACDRAVQTSAVNALTLSVTFISQHR